MDWCRFTTTKRERAALGRFQAHSHGIDVIVDVVDEVLVGSFVGGDHAEVIGIWKGDEASAMEVVARLAVALEIVDNGIEGEEEYGGTERISDTVYTDTV